MAERFLYYPTFLNLNEATEAPDYLSHVLVPIIAGRRLLYYF